jgi:hypothetical protein
VVAGGGGDGRLVHSIPGRLERMILATEAKRDRVSERRPDPELDHAVAD